MQQTTAHAQLIEVPFAIQVFSLCRASIVRIFRWPEGHGFDSRLCHWNFLL